MTDSEEPAEREHTQPPEAKDCPVEMWQDKRCGRPLYAAPEGVDERPVCLMHSHDPNKVDVAFQVEIEHTLAAAGVGIADFSHFVFPTANFHKKYIRGECLFYDSTFTKVADFGGATFKKKAAFIGATFTDKADFSSATFEKVAHFGLTTFKERANFRWATFKERADFSEAIIEEGFIHFQQAQFQGSAWFRETKFREDGDEIGTVFSQAWFAKPEEALFYKCNLSQVLFHNCDVSKVTFSNVEWRRRDNSKVKGKRIVFDEVVRLEKNDAGELPDETAALKADEGSADERNYFLIVELYQQLKKNYDDRRDYWTAGDFHYGEMEMKRRSSPRRNWFARRLHRHLGLAAWYKYASGYGESYLRPLGWLLAVLFLFAVPYSFVGLGPVNDSSATAVAASASQSVGDPAVPPENFPQHRPSHLDDLLRGTKKYLRSYSLWTSFYVMALQRDVIQDLPKHWGRFLAVVQLLLTSTLIALFLLAVRRKFRR